MIDADWTAKAPHVQMPDPSRPNPRYNRWSSRSRYYDPPFTVKDSLEVVRREQDAAFDRFMKRVDAQLARRSDAVGALYWRAQQVES